ncbi:hypothetical protein DFH08DRAFT_329342 [Mycena albidolilacea]|uniref:Uncharacterized protein n=1 Tax=Mycena albidolilacea TaxID=1033008 RepID=A0AAD7F2M2_9AGAR|nr:hypothetical protein DFH08DRAFT_329342 [Mycena albidolilacea]
MLPKSERQCARVPMESKCQLSTRRTTSARPVPRSAPRRTHGMRTAGLHLDRKHKERRGLKQPSLPHARTPHPCPPACPKSEGRQRPPAHLRVCTRAAPHSPLRWDERTARSSLETGRDGDEGRREEDGGGAGLRGAREPSPVLRNGYRATRWKVVGWMTLNSREIRLRVGETQRETFRAGVGCAHRQARRRTEDLKLSINCQLQPSPIQELRTNQGRMDWKDADRRTSNKRGEATRQWPIESSCNRRRIRRQDVQVTAPS